MFVRILRQSFQRQPRRKSLALLAVAAGMAVATAMLTLRVDLGDDLQIELRSYGANLAIHPAADSLPLTLNGVDLRPAHLGSLLNETDLARVKTTFWSNNIKAFAPLLNTIATIISPRAAQADTVQVAGTYFDHPIAIAGGERTIRSGMHELEPAWQVDGQWPQDDSNEALAGIRLASRVHLSMGEAFVVRGESGLTSTITITGLLSTGGAEDEELLLPLHVAQTLAGTPGKMRDVLVSAVTKPDDDFARRDPAHMSAADRDRWTCSPYAASIAADLQGALPGAVVTVVRPIADSEGVILSKLHLLLLLITLIALLASALAITGAMTATVLERRGEIALMKAIGAHDGTIGALFFAEAGLLGLVGGALGFFAGEVLASGIAMHVLGHAAAAKPVLAPVILLLAALIALAASLPPLRRAIAIDPAAGLRIDG